MPQCIPTEHNNTNKNKILSKKLALWNKIW
jgi:hypothetical protein